MFIKIIEQHVVGIINSAIIFLMLLLFPIATMAIVNMDGLHFDNNKEAFTADLDLTLSGTSGNSNTEKVALNAQFNWIAARSINLAILGYQYGESNNVRSVNKAFAHYRYIYQLNSAMDWELFGQVEKNEFTRLSFRGLLGTGLRFSVAKTEQHHAFMGLGGFYSKEEIEVSSGLTDGGVEEFGRANFYFLSKYSVSPTVSFSNVLYYQPRFSRFSDYRALFETKFDFKISKKLSFRLSFDVEHDSEPSQTIKNTDVSYMSGLVFNF
jgi:putative salt-induced outer membrane protein